LLTHDRRFPHHRSIDDTIVGTDLIGQAGSQRLPAPLVLGLGRFNNNGCNINNHMAIAITCKKYINSDVAS
jgi:hypothetical protein